MPAKMLKNVYANPRNKLDYSRSIFKYERTHSTNLLTGMIVPVAFVDCLPGTTVPNKFGFVLQSAPLLGPSVDNVYIDIISVWIPTRLVMGDHNEWLGDNDTYAWTLGNNKHLPKITRVQTGTVDAGIPLSKTYYAEHYLGPHLGFRWWYKPDTSGVFTPYTDFASEFNSASVYHNGISVVGSRMYDLVWNRLFRNENIQSPVLFSKQSGTDLSLDLTNYTNGLGVLRRANRMKNVFTTAWISPSIQTIDIGLGKDLPVITGANHDQSGSTLAWSKINGAALTSGNYFGFYSYDGSSTATYQLNAPSGIDNVVPANLWAELSGITVNSLYYSIMLQRYMNKASEGRRPVEFYKIHFGIDKSNAAYDDPELLSQKRYKVNISRVVATGNSTDIDGNTQPLGSQGAFSVTSVGGVLFPEFTATEYGMLQVYAVIRTQPSISTGIDKYLTYHELLSTYLPEFDHIGKEAIELQELANINPFGSLNVFGYQEAWYPYRYQINDSVGIFSPGESLDYMTLTRDFTGGTAFTINGSFIAQGAGEFDRMLQLPVFYGTPGAVDDDGNVIVDAYGEYYESDRYQWVIQFALAGDLVATMSKDSEPLLFGQRI